MRLAPFSGYRIQRLDGLGNFESYFVDEWSTLPYSLGLKNLSFRVIRPVGFFNFFQFLKNHSFFKKENITQAEKLLTLEKSDNTTAIYVKIGGKSQKNFFWQASIFSKKNDKLNSMQKITSLMPATVLDFLLKEEIKIKKGIILMEEIGKEKHLFRKIIGILKNEGVEFKRGK